MNNDRFEGWAAIAAAILVLFSAMWDPRVSVALSMVALVGLGIRQLRGSRPS